MQGVSMVALGVAVAQPFLKVQRGPEIRILQQGIAAWVDLVYETAELQCVEISLHESVGFQIPKYAAHGREWGKRIPFPSSPELAQLRWVCSCTRLCTSLGKFRSQKTITAFLGIKRTCNVGSKCHYRRYALSNCISNHHTLSSCQR